MDAILFAIEQSLDLINLIYLSAKALGENSSLLKSLQSRIKRIRLNLYVFCTGSCISKVHEDVASRLREDFNLIYNQLQPVANRVSKPRNVRNFLASTNITKDLQAIRVRLTAMEKHLDSYGLMLNLRTAYQSQEDLLKNLHQLMLRFADELGGNPSDQSPELVSQIAQLSLQGEDQSSSQPNLDMEEGKDLQLIAALPSIRRQITASEIARTDKDRVNKTIDDFENNWRLNFNDLTFETRRGRRWKVIGKGGFSTVYAAHLQLRGEDGDPRGAAVAVAVKELDINESELEQHKPHFLREVHTLMQFAQPCILHTYGAMWPELVSSERDCVDTKQSSGDDDDFSPMIITERMTFDLANALSGQSLQNTQTRRDIAIDIATALSYLHQNGLVHRDVKPENVFLRVVDGKLVGRAKLGDFGVSRRVQTTRKMKTYSTRGGGGASGTIIYMPPEVLEDVWNCKTRRSWDVWSFGLLLCFLGGRKDAFSLAIDAVNAAELAKSGRLVAASRKWAESICDSKMKGAALQCLEGSWQRRPTMEAVLLTLTADVKSSAAVSAIVSGPASFEAAKKGFQKFLEENDREAGNEACYVFKKEFEGGNLNAALWLMQAEYCSLAGFTWGDGFSTKKKLEKALENRNNLTDYDAIKFASCVAADMYSSKMHTNLYPIWKAAGDDGNLIALALASGCLQNGNGVKKNVKAAEEGWSRFQELAEKAKSEEYDMLEWSEILFLMGVFYFDECEQGGKGMQCLSESADLGNAEAPFCLSLLYEQGVFVERDLEKADELLGIAIRRGSHAFFTGFVSDVIEREPEFDKIDWSQETSDLWEGTIAYNEFPTFAALCLAWVYKVSATAKRMEGHLEEAQRSLEAAAIIMRRWQNLVEKEAKSAPLFRIFRLFSKRRISQT